MIYTIHHFDSVGSTNDTAMQMAREGAPEGTVVAAHKQTSGKGRRGKQWSSPPGTGLYLSIVLHPHKSLDEIWQISFLGSLATAEAVREVSGLPAQIKWPNDVLVNGRKVCGILVESRPQTVGDCEFRIADCGLGDDPSPLPSPARGEGSRFPKSCCMRQVSPLFPAPPIVVLGIGVNVSTSAFPRELEGIATSILVESGRLIGLDEMEGSLLDSLRMRYEEYLSNGFSSILEPWRVLDCTSGRRVRVDTPEGLNEGVAAGVDETGALIVERDGGERVVLHAGTIL